MARQSAIGVEELIMKKVATIRRWKKTNLMKRRSNWDFQFTVMTYNILSQNALENHGYMYRNCPSTFLLEDYRISRIIPEILQSNCDIICLQEVEQHLFDNRMKKVFDLKGFASLFKRRTGCKSDGCAILWRKGKFNLVNHRDIEFRTKSNQLLDRDNIGLIAVFKPNHPKSDNTLLHVATTHLLFNPRRGDIKFCQIRLLLAELERLSLKKVVNGKRHYHPLVLCGDFNFEPYSPLYRFIENGCIDVANIRSGDLSGQAEGKNKGQLIHIPALLLYELGISDATRFERNPSRNKVDKKLLGTELTWPPKQLETDSNASSSPKADDGQTNSSSAPPVGKSIDPNLLAALGSSTDPRWIKTMMTLGNYQLAAELTTRTQTVQGSEHESSRTVNPVQGSQVSESPERGTDSEQEETRACFYHDFKFVPAYRYHHMNPKDIPITSMTGRDFNNVDHIFYNVKKKTNATSFCEGQLRLLSIYSLMRVDDAKELGSLPNAGLGSDHICLIAQFALTQR